MGTLRRYWLLMVGIVVASEDFTQKEISFFDLLDLDAETTEQKLVLPDEFPAEPWTGVAGGKGVPVRRQFAPRSMPPHIPFPPARPTDSNLHAICHHGNRRPRYPKNTLPDSGFGYLYRQANTINQLESWFATCCSSEAEDEDLTLCCVQQAWENALSDFCTAEFMIKTSHYHCCKQKQEAAVWECFEKNAPDHSYQASGDKTWTNIHAPTFNFNPSTCQKTSSEVTPRGIREMGTPISFPLGRPNSANIESICAHRKQRRRYLSKCLPSSGYDWLARQTKAINGLEKRLGQCCKQQNDQQACAERKWKKMVVKFCKDEKKAKDKQFDCCKKERGEEQYECFAAAAPNPDYILEDDHGPPAQAHPVLDMLCDSEIVTLQRGVELADLMAERCCPQGEERAACFQTELRTLENQLCKDDQSSGPCCMKKVKSRPKCFTKLLLSQIPEINTISRNKKCPISS